MSFTGQIKEKCPGCSEENEYEMWSFVRGDQDETLRDRLKGGELNVLECPDCGRLFYPETSWVYADSTYGLVAFVFPESFAKEEERWRRKMSEDFQQVRPVAEKIGIFEEPLIFFGGEALAQLIISLEFLDDEAQVARWVCKELGLEMRSVKPSFARALNLPKELPYPPRQAKFSRQTALSSLRRLLEANDRLDGYRRWVEYLEGPGPEPPFAQKA